MNKKNMWIIAGIILVLLIIYLIFNPTWITKPKYMLDKQYCEQDSECVVQTNNCDAVNIYNYYKSYTGTSCFEKTCGASCIQNMCELNLECNRK